MKKNKTKGLFASIVLGVAVTACASASSSGTVTVVDRPDIQSVNTNYIGYRAPLRPLNFIKLPVGSIQPEGWVKKYLELQRDGLTGHLGEISAWLEKDNNAWLTTGGDHGWEEVPYWLKGYGNLAYILNDPKMIEETKYWIEGVFASRQPDGYFGPVNERNGKRELWAQMIMLWCLQSYYEYSQDQRVIDLMTNYFKWQMTVPDDQLLEDYWEKSRGGDNIISIYWLYNHTGDAFLLELAEKIHRNTADWTKSTSLPNWHNVNIAQCFREPATYYMQTGDSAMLKASYNVHHLIRRTFGQVPGGMFGADENARLGYIDPRQGVETCGLVEQMASDEIMLCMTGDPMWAEHCEEVAFNSYPAAVMPDFKALRYITCPNHAISDSKNHLYFIVQKRCKGSNFHRTFITFALFSYRNFIIFCFFFSDDEHIRNTFQFIVTNLTTDFFISVIYQNTNVLFFQLTGDVPCIFIELLTDRHDTYLIRSQPQREFTSCMFDQHGNETFH